MAANHDFKKICFILVIFEILCHSQNILNNIFLFINLVPPPSLIEYPYVSVSFLFSISGLCYSALWFLVISANGIIFDIIVFMETGLYLILMYF